MVDKGIKIHKIFFNILQSSFSIEFSYPLQAHTTRFEIYIGHIFLSTNNYSTTMKRRETIFSLYTHNTQKRAQTLIHKYFICIVHIFIYDIS